MAPMPEEAPVTRAVPWVWGEFMGILLGKFWRGGSLNPSITYIISII
jgi:hypothetical protein